MGNGRQRIVIEEDLGLKSRLADLARRWGGVPVKAIVIARLEESTDAELKESLDAWAAKLAAKEEATE